MIALVLLAQLAGGVGTPTPQAEELTGSVFEALEMWDLQAARAAIDRLGESGAPPEVMTEVQGDLLLFSGDYAGAVKLLAGTDSPYAHLAESTLKETASYEHQESEHFSLSYAPGKDAILAPYALDTLERARARIGEDLGELPKEKIRVEILRDPSALSRLSPLTEDEIHTTGTIALCKYNKLMIVSPRAMATGYTWQDTLAHELTHYLITRKSQNKTPIWIHEGIAKYEESRWRGSAGEALSPATVALLARRLEKGTLIPFAKMHPSIAMLKSQEDAALAFAEVFTTIEFLRQVRHASIERLLQELSSGASDTQAVALVAGEPFDRMTEDWKAYLRRRPTPKEFLPLEPEKLKFKASAKDEEPTEDLAAEIDDVNARSWAHLGELLLTRSRQSAALIELGKAEGRVGARSPSLSNLYARALLAAGRAPEAERVLRASLVPYPDIAQTHLRLAELESAGEHWDKAQNELEAANAVDPFDPLIHQGLLKVASVKKDAAGVAREKAALAILAKD